MAQKPPARLYLAGAAVLLGLGGAGILRVARGPGGGGEPTPRVGAPRDRGGAPVRAPARAPAAPAGTPRGREPAAGRGSDPARDRDAPPPAAVPGKAAAGASPILRLRAVEAGSRRPLGGERFHLVARPVVARAAAAGRGERSLRALSSDAGGWLEISGLPPGEQVLELRHRRFLPRSFAVHLAEPGEGAGAVEKEVALQEGETLTGRVTDLRGRPLAGASLILSRRGGSGPERAAAASGEDGRFRFEGLEAGRWGLVARAAGHGRSPPLEVEVPARGPLQVILAPAPSGRVRVVRRSGEPVEGAKVEARLVTEARGLVLLPPAASGPGGEAEIRELPADPPARVALRARAAGLLPAERTVTAEEIMAGAPTLVLEPPARLRGRVVDGTGLGVANSRVTLSASPAPPLSSASSAPSPSGVSSGARGRSLASTADGSFLFRGLPGGRYSLAAWSALEGRSPRLEVDVEPGGEAEVTLVLAAGPEEVSGQVLGEGGEPAALAPVRLVEAAGGKDAVERRLAAGREGRFRFGGLEAGRYLLRAGDGDLGLAERVVGAGESGLILRLERPGSIRGLVSGEVGPYTLLLFPDFPEGGGETDPAARRGPEGGRDGPLWSWRFTRGAGRFHLRRIPPGAYRLVLRRGERDEAERRGLVVRPGEELGPVVIDPPGERDEP